MHWKPRKTWGMWKTTHWKHFKVWTFWKSRVLSSKKRPTMSLVGAEANRTLSQARPLDYRTEIPQRNSITTNIKFSRRRFYWGFWFNVLDILACRKNIGHVNRGFSCFVMPCSTSGLQACCPNWSWFSHHPSECTACTAGKRLRPWRGAVDAFGV